MNGEMFVLYMTTQLSLTLYQGDVIILGKLSSQKSPASVNALHAIDACCLFLPPLAPIPLPSKRHLQRARRHSERRQPEHTFSYCAPSDAFFSPLLRHSSGCLLGWQFIPSGQQTIRMHRSRMI